MEPRVWNVGAYIGGADKLFGDDGSIAVESTRQFLDQFMRTFAGWIDRFEPAVAGAKLD